MMIIIGEGGKGGTYNDDYNRRRWDKIAHLTFN